VIALPDGTSAFDIADLDGDGRTEVIAVSGDRVLRCAIDGDAANPLAEDLFTIQTQLGLSRNPYPQVLVVQQGGRSLLALPCASAIELRSADGALISRHEIPERTHLFVADAHRLALFQFPRRGSDLYLNVWIERMFEPSFSTTDASFSPLPITPMKQGPRRFVYAEGHPKGPYAWFPLRTDGTTLLRALCRPGRGQSTIVRIREAPSEEDDCMDKNTTVGPERNYPGEQVQYDEDLPDFNGDGYVDLTRWKAPSPGMSVDALTRAITGGAWPLDLVFHLFSPEKRRFEATACSRIALTVPVRWFLEGEPVQNEVFRDFDGDKHTDFALSDTDHSFSAWLFTDNGFSRSPDFRHTFPESIQDVAFRADLDGSGRTSIGLRTDKHLYLLKATS
jgi:hypothetical protein